MAATFGDLVRTGPGGFQQPSGSDWSSWGQSGSYDGRSNVQRVAETLFEYIDVAGQGYIDAALIRASTGVLKPEEFDAELQSSPRLADILIPQDLGQQSMPCRAFTTHLREVIAQQPRSKRVLQRACDIILANTRSSRNGGMERNWCLFLGSLPLILATFITMLDNMWKGRFMAAMLIVHHANGVYCPYAHTIYANWGCRGIEAGVMQICDMGIHRGTPLDPLGLYHTFGCGYGESLFIDSYTRSGSIDGIDVQSLLRNCTSPNAQRTKEIDTEVTLGELGAMAFSDDCANVANTDDDGVWCAPIPDNVLRTSEEYAAALEEAITPGVGEIIYTIFVLAALPACYFYTPVGRRWIMMAFPEETFEGIKELTISPAVNDKQYSRAEVRANGSRFAKLLLVGYVASCIGFLLSQFPIAPGPPSPLVTRAGSPVQHDQSACFFDWTQYPGDNAAGCTGLEAYYSAGLKRDAETLNLATFLIFGTAMFYSLWKSGRYSNIAALEIYRESRQLGRIRVATTSRNQQSVRSVPEVLETIDEIVRFERRKRTGRNWWHLLKSLVTWAVPTVIMGTAIRWSDAILADGISYREGSVVGLLVVLCNVVAFFSIFYSMSHVFFTVSQHYEDTLERMRCLSTMLCPGPASGKGLPCIRVGSLGNLHGWIRMRQFIIRWAGRKHLENSQLAMGLLVPISIAMAAATWFVVVGKPATTYSAYVVSWIVFFSLVLLACGDSVLRAAIMIDEEVATQAGLVRQLALDYQLAQLDRSSLTGSPGHKRSAHIYTPTSRTPSPTVDQHVEDDRTNAETVSDLDHEEPSAFHTPSRRKLRGPQEGTADDDAEEELPALTVGATEEILPALPQIFQPGTTEQMSRTPSPSPLGSVVPVSDNLPGQILRNDVLAMLIAEIMDDNSNPVRLRFFGVSLNRNLRSVLVGAFGVAGALFINAARKSFPITTGGAFIDPSD